MTPRIIGKSLEAPIYAVSRCSYLSCVTFKATGRSSRVDSQDGPNRNHQDPEGVSVVTNVLQSSGLASTCVDYTAKIMHFVTLLVLNLSRARGPEFGLGLKCAAEGLNLVGAGDLGVNLYRASAFKVPFPAFHED